MLLYYIVFPLFWYAFGIYGVTEVVYICFYFKCAGGFVAYVVSYYSVDSLFLYM